MRISDWSSDVCSSDLLAAMLGDRRNDDLPDVGAGASWRSDAAEQYEFGVLPSCKTRRQMEVPFEERRLLELDHVEILRRLDPYERRRRGTDTPCAEKACVDALHHQRAEIGRAHACT